MKKVTLKRCHPGHYVTSTPVTVKDSGIEPYVIDIYGPDSGVDTPTNFRWVVESDQERFFPTLRDARDYLNRFYEPAGE